MKITQALIITLLFVITSFAQSQKISREKYDDVFRFAVSETNADYPLIFTVVTEFFEDGKVIRTKREVNENEARGRYRIKKTTIAGGKETSQYQISYDGNVYCSDDGISWTPPSKYECESLFALYKPREPESVEYSVIEKSVNGKKVKLYRKFEIFLPKNESGKKSFIEEIATIDSRGFFITVVSYEGILNPKTTTFKRTQSWNTKAKFKTIVPPESN